MTSDFERQLEELRSSWKNKKPLDMGFQIPEGLYKCQLVKVKLKEEMVVIWTFKILAGDYTGKSITIFNDILYRPDNPDKPDGATIFITNLHRLGLTCPDLTVPIIAKSIEKGIGAQVEISVVEARKNGKVYSNKYINTLLKPSNASVAASKTVAPEVSSLDEDETEDETEDAIDVTEDETEVIVKEEKVKVGSQYQFYDPNTNRVRNATVVKLSKDGTKAKIQFPVGRGMHEAICPIGMLKPPKEAPKIQIVEEEEVETEKDEDSEWNEQFA